jgi:hypothetical protein
MVEAWGVVLYGIVLYDDGMCEATTKGDIVDSRCKREDTRRSRLAALAIVLNTYPTPYPDRRVTVRGIREANAYGTEADEGYGFGAECERRGL